MATGDDDAMLFPQKLMGILADPLNQRAISWLPDGHAFVIRDRELFMEVVMPQYFPRKTKFSSFTRKLHRWNFMRLAYGPDQGAFFHDFFRRDHPHLVVQMFCKNSRSLLAMTSVEVEKNAETTPLLKRDLVKPITNKCAHIKDSPVLISKGSISSLQGGPSLTTIRRINALSQMQQLNLAQMKPMVLQASTSPTGVPSMGSAAIANPVRTTIYEILQQEKLKSLLVKRAWEMQQEQRIRQERLLQVQRIASLQQHLWQEQNELQFAFMPPGAQSEGRH